MKGIVMEVGEKDLTVLTPGGAFVRMKRKSRDIRVGQEVDLKDARKEISGALRRLSALAASLLIFVGAGLGVHAYFAPAGYVDVDINPGIELAYNRFGKVIKAEGINGDGQAVLEAMESVKHQPWEEALEEILETAEAEGFLDGNDPEEFVHVYVVGKDGERNRQRAENVLESHHEQSGAGFGYKAESGSLEERETLKAQAEALGADITPGKLNLLKKVYAWEAEAAEEEGAVAVFEAYVDSHKNWSVKDLMQPFNRGKGQGPQEEKENENKPESDAEDVEKGNPDKGNRGNGNEKKGSAPGKGGK